MSTENKKRADIGVLLKRLVMAWWPPSLREQLDRSERDGATLYRENQALRCELRAAREIIKTARAFGIRSDAFDAQVGGALAREADLFTARMEHPMTEDCVPWCPGPHSECHNKGIQPPNA